MAEEFWEGTKKGVVMMKVTKEEKELFEIVRKIKPEQWKALHGFMGEAKEVLAQGRITTFFKSELMAIKDDLISMFVDPLVAPLLEAFAPIMANLLETVIPALQDVILTLGEAIGTIVGIELPGGEDLGSVLGKLLAWSIEWTSPVGIFGKLLDAIKQLAEIFGGDWWEAMIPTKPWPGEDPMAEAIAEALGLLGYEFE